MARTSPHLRVVTNNVENVPDLKTTVKNAGKAALENAAEVLMSKLEGKDFQALDTALYRCNAGS